MFNKNNRFTNAGCGIRRGAHRLGYGKQMPCVCGISPARNDDRIRFFTQASYRILPLSGCGANRIAYHYSRKHRLQRFAYRRVIINGNGRLGNEGCFYSGLFGVQSARALHGLDRVFYYDTTGRIPLYADDFLMELLARQKNTVPCFGKLLCKHLIFFYLGAGRIRNAEAAFTKPLFRLGGDPVSAYNSDIVLPDRCNGCIRFRLFLRDHNPPRLEAFKHRGVVDKRSHRVYLMGSGRGFMQGDVNRPAYARAIP
jgi:hypothetical protein